MITNGCKKIAYLSISENLSIDNKRKQGYFEALNKHDIKIEEPLIVRCSNDEKKNISIIKENLIPATQFPIDVEILIMADYKWKHKCDADNIIKPLVDLLVRAEIVPDDKTRYINSVKVRYLQGFGPPVTCISYTIVED